MAISITVYVVMVIFLATLIRSSLGFGEALVAVPLLALRIPVIVAAPLAVAVSVIVAGMIVAQDWRNIEIKSAMGLLISALFGIPIGLFLLTHANEHAIKLLLGILIVCFSIYSLVFRSKVHLVKDHLAWLLGAGFCSGILGGAYGMNGPALAVYGSLRRWPPQRFRATLQCYFFPASLVVLLGYATKGLYIPVITRYFIFSLPGIVIAVLIGRALNRRLRGESFFQYVYVGLIVIGLTLLFQAGR
jgi:hypothetical protein